MEFSHKSFNADSFHQTQLHPEKALLQLFILDFMNFCFWPLPGFEYHHLATHIQQAVNEGLSLHELKSFTSDDVVNKLFHGVKVPMADERARLLRELGSVIVERFGGSFNSVIMAGNGSVVKLLQVLTENFPNFQDHSIYEGHQVHFYKRAQILIGDIHGRF